MGHQVGNSERVNMRASQRCMRFTAAALACNAVCLGFVTGFPKARSHATSQSLPTSLLRMGREGVRGRWAAALGATGLPAEPVTEGRGLGVWARRLFRISQPPNAGEVDEPATSAGGEGEDIFEVCNPGPDHFRLFGCCGRHVFASCLLSRTPRKSELQRGPRSWPPLIGTSSHTHMGSFGCVRSTM